MFWILLLLLKLLLLMLVKEKGGSGSRRNSACMGSRRLCEAEGGIEERVGGSEHV